MLCKPKPLSLTLEHSNTNLLTFRLTIFPTRSTAIVSTQLSRDLLSLQKPIANSKPPDIMAGKRLRCNAKECREPAQRIVGDCGFCNGHFCGKHRLLEDHKCSGLEDCKKQSHERNAAQLESERTQVIRGV